MIFVYLSLPLAGLCRAGCKVTGQLMENFFIGVVLINETTWWIKQLTYLHIGKKGHQAYGDVLLCSHLCRAPQASWYLRNFGVHLCPYDKTGQFLNTETVTPILCYLVLILKNNLYFMASFLLDAITSASSADIWRSAFWNKQCILWLVCVHPQWTEIIHKQQALYTSLVEMIPLLISVFKCLII